MGNGVGDSMVSRDEYRLVRTFMETMGALDFGNNTVNKTSERIGRMIIVRSLKIGEKKKNQLLRPLKNTKRD
jgi:hypothetical protein